MTVTALLLREAEAALRLTEQAGDLSRLETAFVAWLRGEPPPAGLADVFAAPVRQYEHVALASLAETAGWAVDKSSLEDGLQWVVEVALERAGVPAPVLSDGLAHVVFSLAVRERPWLSTWHDQVLARGAESVTPSWLVGGGRVSVGGGLSAAVELRIALASRGVGVSTDADANELLQRLLRGELADDAFHAHVLLVALEWTRRSAPLVLPGRATVETVADLLRAVPRALQQWPWEEKAKTPKSRPAKWHIDCEYHVQSLLWSILAPVFPDLRREDVAAQVGPTQPRIDFIIPSLRLALEAKFARTRSALKDTVNEIAEDASLYFASPSAYDRLLVFVWDNEGHTQDHDIIITGMRKFDRVADVIIVSRPGHMI